MEKQPRNLSFDPSRLTKVSAADYSSSDSDAEEEDEFLMPSRGPGEHEFADFQHPRKRRRTGRNTKESAALGIFGSDSEDDGPGARWKHKTLRNKSVSFVSQGKRSMDSEDEEEEEGQDSSGAGSDNVREKGDTDARASSGERDTMQPRDGEEDEDEDEEEERGGVGLGFGGVSTSPGQGLGWRPSSQQPGGSNSTPKKPSVKAKYDGSTPLGQSFTPSSAKQPILKVQDEEPPALRTSLPSAFASSRNGKPKLNPKSFGARMMAKMGYVEGQGLGKEGQGRSAIIEANLRPQKIGLGAVKEKTAKEREEEKRQARLRGEVVVDSDEEEKKKKAARRKKTALGGIRSETGSGASTPKRAKQKFLTLDEIRKAAPGLKIPEAFTPILDMTGPGQKMLTTSSGLMTPSGGAEATTESTEAVESRKLARRAQNDFMAILEEWQSLQERKAYLDLQLQHEQQELDEFLAGLEGNKSISASCDKLSHPSEVDDADRQTGLGRRLSQIMAELKVAAASLSDDILPRIKDELTAAAVAAIHPPLKEYMSVWDPLEEPKPKFLDDMVAISDLLGHPRPAAKAHHRGTATPFEAMMYKLWLPRVASAVREWNVRDSDQMLAVFEAWEKLMPRFVRTQLLEQDVVRKLEEAVAKWEPKRKKHHQHRGSLPHVWIFPWLQYLPAHHLDPRSATGLVADVKRKFRQLIDVWEFDRGVVPDLKQWKEVLRPSKSQDQWRPLVMNHILPGMARYLRTQFRVDPQDQEPYLEMLSGVCAWLGILSASLVGEVLVAEVFPLWHEVLYQWLVAEEANYEEIGQWFLWWQDEVFPEEIKALPAIAAEFAKGNALIERALDLGDRVAAELEPPSREPALPSSRSRHERRHHERETAAAAAAAASAPPAAAPEEAQPATFKSIVEDWCQANDLQFIPERKKVHAEGPLYRITARGDGRGGVLVYFKGDRLFAETRKDGLVELRADRPGDLVVLMEYAQ
ncbi:hypothetical protein VTK73DRAFT_1475 [Phialemonium thermophilum]|uniref:G-patch domain-containing protein n=1 Tax=Phialemonium thermophilum TaxID=223376 RepID=A0ABR3X937_9PEZI